MMNIKKIKKLVINLLFILWIIWGIYFIGKSTYLFIKYGVKDDFDSSLPKQVEIFNLTIPETSLIYFEHINDIDNPHETLVYYSASNRCVVYNNFPNKEDKNKYEYYYISDEDRHKIIQLINNTERSNQNNSILLDENNYYANQYINRNINKKLIPLDISKLNFQKLS